MRGYGRRLSYEEERAIAERRLIEVEYNLIEYDLDLVPCWIADDLREEKSRLLKQILQCEVALTTGGNSGSSSKGDGRRGASV